MKLADLTLILLAHISCNTPEETQDFGLPS